MARPNSNTTGISILATELNGKRQEILIELVPGLRRMAILADSNNTMVAQLNALQKAARARNIELSIQQIIASGEEIVAAIDMAQASGAKASTFRRHRCSSPMSAYYRPSRSTAPAGDL